jgi:hypothetical protein
MTTTSQRQREGTMSFYTDRTIYYLTPLFRRSSESELQLAAQFKASQFDMRKIREIYRALRSSGMGQAKARFYVYDVVAGIVVPAERVQI